MKPIKFSTLLPAISILAGQPEAVTALVLQLYWREVRAALSGLVHPNVKVYNLCTFTVKQSAMERKLRRRQSLAASSTGASTRQQAVRSIALQEVEQLEALQDMLRKEKDRRKQVRGRRTIQAPYETKPDTDLEKEEPDL